MLFDKTTQGLTAAGHYSSLRHKVVANNIANVDTPGYKALDISFGQQLDDLITAGKNESRSPEDPTTILIPDLNGRRPSIDGNTVNIDQQLTMLSQNAIYHNACMQLLNSKFRILKTALSPNS